VQGIGTDWGRDQILPDVGARFQLVSEGESNWTRYRLVVEFETRMVQGPKSNRCVDMSYLVPEGGSDPCRHEDSPWSRDLTPAGKRTRFRLVSRLEDV